MRFLRAPFKGWICCRDNFAEGVDLVLKNGPMLGKSHISRMLNEINALIWPPPHGIGRMDPKAFEQTAQVAQ